MDESLDVEKLFREMEFNNFCIKHGFYDEGIKIKKEDITTKDGRVLSQKQANCLYNYFDLDLDITIKYIRDNNYDEISKTIGKALKEIKGNRYGNKCNI